MNNSRTIHKTVLKEELIKYLDVRSEGTYIDLTLGGGGHSLKILEFLENGNLIAFDLSEEAISRVRELIIKEYNESSESEIAIGTNVSNENKTVKVIELKKGKVKVYLVNSNFARLKETLEELDIKTADGILADLGWSSDQLEDIEGLSYKNGEDELDMRFDLGSAVKAKDLLNALGRRELKLMFSKFSDIFGRQSNRLVDAILTTRKARAIEKVKDLTSLINQSFPQLERENKSFGFYSKVFQALRIAVNNEYTNLEEVLEQSINLLKKEGRLAVITFHSGEEKIVKEFIKKNIKNLNVLSRSSEGNYIRPSIEEITENIRSRSAKLFALKKV